MCEIEFEPELTEQALPDEVAALREANSQADARLLDVLQPRIEGHLLACQQAIATLIEHHRHVVEGTDLDLDAETRPVAIWELAGRCLALSNALLDQLRLGYTAETVGTMRLLHEAANLLSVATNEESGWLTRRWLSGRHVEQRRARQAIGEAQERVVAAAREQGVEIEGDLEELTRQVYGVLSIGGHNDRPGFNDSISRPGRLFVYGPHPSPVIRAEYVSYASELIEQVVLEVGDGASLISTAAIGIGTRSGRSSSPCTRCATRCPSKSLRSLAAAVATAGASCRNNGQAEPPSRFQQTVTQWRWRGWLCA
jgi:hypothetical protein